MDSENLPGSDDIDKTLTLEFLEAAVDLLGCDKTPDDLKDMLVAVLDHNAEFFNSLIK
jgi:hypothetical protein